MSGDHLYETIETNHPVMPTIFRFTISCILLIERRYINVSSLRKRYRQELVCAAASEALITNARAFVLLLLPNHINECRKMIVNEITNSRGLL